MHRHFYESLFTKDQSIFIIPESLTIKHGRRLLLPSRQKASQYFDVNSDQQRPPLRKEMNIFDHGKPPFRHRYLTSDGHHWTDFWQPKAASTSEIFGPPKTAISTEMFLPMKAANFLEILTIKGSHFNGDFLTTEGHKRGRVVFAMPLFP